MGSAAGSSVPPDSSKEKVKYDLPVSCKLEMLKLNRIEKLDEDYVLVAHPYPQLEGEMLLFQIRAEEQEDKECIIYNDYSLRKRITTEPKPARMSAYQKKQMMEEDQERTKLQCLEVDLESPLSTIDWQNFSLVINEIKGMGWI